MNYTKTPYKTILFDCDGVILDSNTIKTNAFKKIASIHGAMAENSLLDYHYKNPGISRFKKLVYFRENILKPNNLFNLEKSISEFGKNVFKELCQCEATSCLSNIKNITKNSKWFVISSSDQIELRVVLKKHNLESFFDGGIFGSPNCKDEIIKRELYHNRIQHPALFFGDSISDYEVAIRNNMDFIFVYGWSEFSTWHKFFSGKNIICIKTLCHLSDVHILNSKTY